MKLKFLYIIAFLFATNNYAQTSSCGSVVDDTFEGGTTQSIGWTEYNTSGRVTVTDGKLKFDHNIDMPSVYHTFNPTSDNSSFSFDVSATRSSVDCRVHLISSTGKYLSTIILGNGNANIEYATSMENGVPGGFVAGEPATRFPANTNFTISTQIDFALDKVDIYVNGELMIADVPFLEDAEDIAKIDIQLLYMYANNGQFYFDNISLLSGEENRLLLTSDVKIAESLLSAAIIGDSYNQYPQSSADVFQLVIDNVNTILADCNSAANIIDDAILELNNAQDIFTTSLVNDPILKIYSDYNFSGEEYEIYAGYYNGTLGAYDNWVSSFTLEKGYMVTFAENINGTGASKVYVAADNDLAIILPVDLQKKVSFIRVSPWFDVHKKGMAGKGTDVIVEFDNSWHYNWGTSGEDVGDAKFVPNQWSGGSVANAIILGNRMDIAHYMAFNEPDGASQANMTVDKAIEKYEAMLASGLRLGSPANKDNANGGVWRDEFMTKALAKGYRVDYIVVHYYKKTTPTNFYNWLKAIHDKWQRPIWIKEFNYGATWTGQPASNEAAGDGLESYINMLDDTDFIERYAVFTWQPDKPIYSLMTVRNPVTLSSSGIMYRDHQSPIAYTQEIYEQGEVLSVEDNSISSEFLIYPSVIENGIFNLKYSSEFKNESIELTIYNTAGQLVKKVSDSTTKIDVSKLSSGLYFVKIDSDLGYFTKKIIIE
ncbi:glycosyl hydrolase [Polaribacter sp. Hel1_85]|uniref:glycosyl hydrolase n=1 Tax=Polaribacter sp. Hel1_85 TaxID=1250005 RepID=UPI00052DD044|nr:glycosyl hydrolase [Polaribacter sp. Hel1_85]KGL58893.1 glycoside hydrolase family [Polaribacter sp. Hel1_85]